MRALLLLTLALAGLAGCGEDPKGKNRPDDDDKFAQSHAVKILSPSHGEVVEPTFTITYELGELVKDFRFEIDGATLTDTGGLSADESSGGGELTVTLDEANHEIRLVGLDLEGNELSDYSIRVAVVDNGPWVAIVSPVDGDTVANPVKFTVDGDPSLDAIELKADGWTIGEVEPGEVLSYEFSGTGYEREVEALGWKDGAVVARDEIAITVEAGTTPVESDFNDLVMDILESYPTDGSYGYYWPEDDGTWWGTTRDVYYRGELMSPGDPQHRSYCVGLTLEVFMRAFEEADAMTGGDGTLNGMPVSEFDEFRTDWFIRDLWGDGNVEALENYGLGEEVTDWDDVRPGDFIQFWRNSGSGHNNIFIDWERDGDGDVIGVTYWSTQGSTDGIGYNTEYFGTSGSTILASYFFVARPYMPEDWISW